MNEQTAKQAALVAGGIGGVVGGFANIDRLLNPNFPASLWFFVQVLYFIGFRAAFAWAVHICGFISGLYRHDQREALPPEPAFPELS